jgi:hypothetical protein
LKAAQVGAKLTGDVRIPGWTTPIELKHY